MDQIQEAVKVLNEGGIVIYPTDTAFAIGCKISDEKAVERLFRVRNRPENKAVPVLIDSVLMAEAYFKKVSKVVKELMKIHWPGALTIVDFCKIEKVPVLVRGGGETLGLRMPNHKTALSIISGVSEPVLGPSANFSENPTPFSYKDLDNDLIRKVDFVVSGETKGLDVSTVIDCTVNPPKILRQGVVSVKSLKL